MNGQLKHYRFILTICYFLLVSSLIAEEFEVLSFSKDENCLDARLEKHKRLDYNDLGCAIIKVRTAISDLGITSNPGVVGNINLVKGEYWVYVSPGTRRLSFFKNDFTRLDYNVPETISEYDVWLLELEIIESSKGIIDIPVAIIFKPDDANLLIDGVEEVTTKLKLSEGEHILKIQRVGFITVTDTLQISVDNALFNYELEIDPESYERMVLVEGGCFKRKFGYTNFEVCLDNFYISKFEITNREYCNFLNSININKFGIDKLGFQLIDLSNHNISYSNEELRFIVAQGRNDYPVNFVSWYGAQKYCEWQLGRLPTEAEWVYAAIGNAEKGVFDFSGGNDLEELGWYNKNGNTIKQVGQKSPNSFGIYDMSGNVSEWCFDYFLENYFINCPKYNPKGPENGFNKVFKGGSFENKKKECKVTERYNTSPKTIKRSIGFRLVRPIESIY